MVKGRQGERVRLYTRGTILGYKRSKSNQYPNTSLVQIEGVNTKEEVGWLLGLMVTLVLCVLSSRLIFLPNPWDLGLECSCTQAIFEVYSTLDIVLDQEDRYPFLPLYYVLFANKGCNLLSGLDIPPSFGVVAGDTDLNADTDEIPDDIEEISPPRRPSGRDKARRVARHAEEVEAKTKDAAETRAKFDEHNLLIKEKK
ncbi:unnamed protein product [Lactuca virosa]|uniref:Uncharacterized protein n=1 Tax=Lactuca virosa TaxID=75947 RepID=A0AAU9NLX2_9ASTR|nr:unnamed protein product [Lactuca virosa]